MPEITLATFNCENLMMRCDFSAARIPNLQKKLTAIADPGEADKVDRAFNVLSEDDRTLTAQALAAAQADVCCLQEVENLVALTAFHNRYLRRWTRKGYPYRVLFEGNDTRGIDVAVLSRSKLVRKVSHADKTYADLDVSPPPGAGKGDRVFRRDCLEVDVEKAGRRLTLFVCHFKSMNGGRSKTQPVRFAEASGLRRIIERRFADPTHADWAAVGDFNDYFELDGAPVDDHAMGPLLEDGFSVDLARLQGGAADDRWTHYYNTGRTYAALDHMFLSPALAAQNADAAARRVRGGQPFRAERYQGRRFPGVGWAHPKASDHCPLSARLRFGEAAS